MEREQLLAIMALRRAAASLKYDAEQLLSASSINTPRESIEITETWLTTLKLSVSGVEIALKNLKDIQFGDERIRKWDS